MRSRVLANLTDGATVVLGSFSWRMGGPARLLRQLGETSARSLRIVALAVATNDDPLVRLVAKGHVRELVLGFNNSATTLPEAAALHGTKLTYAPYGTLVERVRAGACGIAAFYMPVGVGSGMAGDRNIATIDGTPCLLETAIVPDVALLAAATADAYSNLEYRAFYEHLNHYAALAARASVAEVSARVALLPHERIRTPGRAVTEVITTTAEQA